jgi:hypothetical protein
MAKACPGYVPDEVALFGVRAGCGNVPAGTSFASTGSGVRAQRGIPTAHGCSSDKAPSSGAVHRTRYGLR